MDDSSFSSDSSKSYDNRSVVKQEELVTKWRLRLSASHLPKRGGPGLKTFVKTSPDTFATVASIARKSGTPNNRTSTKSISLESIGSHDEYAVTWGSTEIVQNSRSPQWVQTIPFNYEYGSELVFYVRIWQAENSNTAERDVNHKGQSPNSSNPHSDDASVASESFFGTPQKNRRGYCFGTAPFEVGDILGSRNYTKVKRLKAGGCVYAKIEPIEKCETTWRFRFQFQALNLTVDSKRMKTRMGLGSEPTTVLEIARHHDSPSLRSWITVFRSRPVYHSNNPCWDLAEMDLASLCRNNDLSEIVKLSIYRIRSRNRQQQFVGMCETTIQKILANAMKQGGADDYAASEKAPEKDFHLQRNYQHMETMGTLRVQVAFLVTQSGGDMPSPISTTPRRIAIPTTPTSPHSPYPLGRTESTDSRASTGYDDPFNVDLKEISMRYHPTLALSSTSLSAFIDNGGQLDFIVAIDFTSSNGNPLQPGTLHFQTQSDGALNDYEETITCVGNAIDKYNKPSEYCVYGFGAKFGDGVVRHLFQCGPNATVQGVNGILDAYRSVFRSGGITMSGPTVFVNAIQAAAVRARKYKMDNSGGPLRYCILLIVTDGIMDNFDETKQRLEVYGEVPLSVVFVGVGRSGFQPMYRLCQQQSAARKNATFVEFRQHQHDPRSLAEAALQEIPSQLSCYMAQNGLAKR